MKKANLDVFELEPTAAPKAVLDERDKKMVCLLIANGEPEEAVSHKLGFTMKQVSDVIRSDGGLEMIIRLQTALYPDPMQRVKRLGNMALDAQLRILLRSTSDATVAKVASDMLDRGSGKAVQVVESRNLNVSITDMAAADRAMKTANERLAYLEDQQNKLLAARHAALKG